jgi:hypothetical protein
MSKKAMSKETGKESMTMNAERNSKRNKKSMIATSTEPIVSAEVMVLTALWVISVLS